MPTAFDRKLSRKPRALVVDDSQIARYVLSDMLERLGLEIEVADSAEIGLQILRERAAKNDIAVVFMDYMLPGIDGLEAVRRLRAREATMQLPVIMYTSEDSLEFRKRAGAAGANEVFVKTARQDALREILARLNIVAADAPEAEAGGKVVSMRSGSPARDGAGLADPTGIKLLARSLEAHHASLRSDLLAEFAILERHEEKMRTELASRVNLVARYTVAQLQKAAEESRREQAAARDEESRRAWGRTAMLMLAAILALGLGWQALESYTRIEARLAASNAALEAQSQTVAALQVELLAADSPATAGIVPRETAPLAMPEPSRVVDRDAAPVLPASSAASALVGEMQSMGIMGRIRIETDAGSFCVGTASGDYRIEGGSLSLSECEPLPIRPQTTP